MKFLVSSNFPITQFTDMNIGYPILGTLYWIPYIGYPILDTLYWVPYIGYPILDTLYWIPYIQASQPGFTMPHASQTFLGLYSNSQTLQLRMMNFSGQMSVHVGQATNSVINFVPNGANSYPRISFVPCWLYGPAVLSFLTSMGLGQL